jgi:hypothetical protein
MCPDLEPRSFGKYIKVISKKKKEREREREREI